MKRFLLFIGNTYYASGGWRDLQSDHDTIEEAQEIAYATIADDIMDWWHVVDTTTMKEVAGYGRAQS